MIRYGFNHRSYQEAFFVTSKKDDIIELYTDGACRGNPGPGGWAALLRYKGVEKILSGGEPHTTNNRMELMAAIKGLSAITRPAPVALYTDSEYVQKGITKWIHAWRQKNWHTAGKKPVKNKELWHQLEDALSKHQVSWHWVKGHSGHPENDRVDAIARLEIEALSKKGQK